MSNILEKQFIEVRSEFPILDRKVHGHPFVYLDSAATTQKPTAVIDAMDRFYREQYGTVHRAIYTTAQYASEEYQKVREKVQHFIHAESTDEVIFTRGTTSALNIVARCFGKAFVGKGDEVLITEMEHHSNIVPWQMMAEERGAVLKIVPFDDTGVLDMQAMERLITNKTKIISVVHVSNALGTVNPIKDIVALAKRVGAKVCVDGAQSAPHFAVDVQDLGIDFFAFSGHKMVGPTGVGVLWGRKELLDEMPPYEGGGDMIETVTFEKTTYNTVPLKFEAGTPMIAEVIGLGVAIDYLMAIGMRNIEAWEYELFSYAKERVSAIKELQILGRAEKKSGVLTFVVDGVHPLDIATLLDLRGVAVRSGHLCAQPVMRHFGVTAAARASIAFYNNKKDLDIFAEALQGVIHQLR